MVDEFGLAGLAANQRADLLIINERTCEIRQKRDSDKRVSGRCLGEQYWGRVI